MHIPPLVFLYIDVALTIILLMILLLCNVFVSWRRSSEGRNTPNPIDSIPDSELELMPISITLTRELSECKICLDSIPAFELEMVPGSITVTRELSDCAICLSEFKNRETLRLLPICNHAFHACCVDTWLMINARCPLCRESVQNLASSAQSGDRNRQEVAEPTIEIVVE